MKVVFSLLHKMCSIPHRAGNNAVADNINGQRFSGIVINQTPPTWLQANQPTAGCRNADRTTTVVGMGDWHYAGRYQCSRSPGRCSGREGRIPGVTCGREMSKLSRSIKSELGK